MPDPDIAFAGSIPELYERLLVPMIFEPYAHDLARRVAALAPARVLETAAGTGALTRAMVRALGPHAEIVATDLNRPMLDRAAQADPGGPVQWQVADALNLPFPDASFDAVVCQFGAMFFPDKVRAFAEARRVLRHGGTLLLSVWDRIEENEFADTVTATLGRHFPADPPLFMVRTPHGYFDRDAVLGHVAQAGFAGAPAFETVAARSLAPSASSAAVAYCQGTPMRHEIEARAPAGLAEATSLCAAALAERFGTGALDAKIQAHVVTATR